MQIPILALLMFATAPASGPAVGTAVPQFSLPDQNGTQQSLKALLGPKGALLVFYRSADW